MPKPEPCKCHTGPEWSGYPNPANPDKEWICDECGRIILAEEDDGQGQYECQECGSTYHPSSECPNIPQAEGRTP